MTLQMIDPDKRLSQANGQAFGSAVPHEERREQTWAARGGYAIDFSKGRLGPAQSCLDEWTDSRQMIPGGHFRDHAAVRTVQVDLARYFGGQNVARASKKRHRRLVTRRLDR